MAEIQSRVPFSPEHPYRKVRPTTSKIIFLSMEGCATEEDYFTRISEIFEIVKTKIQVISVADDAVKTPAKRRTTEQNKMLSKVRPIQLVERIEKFKEENEDVYQFSLFPDDEFWIVTDVDKNWSDEPASKSNTLTLKQEWENTVNLCNSNNYSYAISNPSFEMWLLLHHDDPNEEDKLYPVTDSNSYNKTPHFRNRLRDLHVPLKGKNLRKENYIQQNVFAAIERAERLHIEKQDLCPKYFATTVYLILKK